MGTVLEFSQFQKEEPDVYSMELPQLRTYLEQLRARIAMLDEREPEDMDSEEYEDWGDAHEELEDLVDEVIERMEELE